LQAKLHDSVAAPARDDSHGEDVDGQPAQHDEDVALLSAPEAATALVRNASRDAGEHTTSAVPIDVPDEFAIARGAAIAVEPVPINVVTNQ
jgi:hypothetical protein